MTIQIGVHADVSRASYGDEQLVTFRIGEQLFGIPALKVRDVLRTQPLTRVPLSPAAVSGSINLRGHIVTAIDVRVVLALGAAPADLCAMCIVVDIKGEPICLMVDAVGDVASINAADVEPNPGSLSPEWSAMSRGIARLRDGLLIILDVDKLVTR